MFGGHGKMSRLFGGRDHNNFMDNEDPWLGQQDQQQQQQPQMPAAKPGNGATDLGQLAKIKAELDAALVSEKPHSGDPAVKQSPKLGSRETRAFEPSAAGGAFAAQGSFPPPSGQQMSPRALTRERAGTDDGTFMHRSASQKAKKKERRRSDEDGAGGGQFGEFPQSQEAFGFAQASPANNFSQPATGFGDFGGWPEAATKSPPAMPAAAAFPPQQPSPPPVSAQRMSEEMLETGVTQRSSGSMAEPEKAVEERAPTAPGPFDEAILAALAALPEQSLVDVLRKILQRRPQAVSTAMGPGHASVRSQDIQAVVQSGLPTRSDRGVPVLAPVTPASPGPVAAASEEIAETAPRPRATSSSSPPQTFASPRLEDAAPVPAPEGQFGQPEGGPWQPQAAAPGNPAFRASPVPQQLSRGGSAPTVGPWAPVPPSTSVASSIGSPWNATPDPSAQAQPPPQEGTPPQSSTGSLQGSKPWGPAPTTTSPWG